MDRLTAGKSIRIKDEARNAGTRNGSDIDRLASRGQALGGQNGVFNFASQSCPPTTLVVPCDTDLFLITHVTLLSLGTICVAHGRLQSFYLHAASHTPITFATLGQAIRCEPASKQYCLHSDWLDAISLSE